MYVALLRGVNVGGKNMVPMKELAALFASQGCTNVLTYIQSGNLIFNAEKQVSIGLEERLSQCILERFACKVPVVLRTSAELAKVIRTNPYLKAGSPEEILHVSFLASKPTAKDVATLDPARSMPDSFCVIGREIYLQLPNGGGNSKLTNAYFDSKLKTVSTVRNWRTVLKLAEMMRGPDAL